MYFSKKLVVQKQGKQRQFKIYFQSGQQPQL